MALCLTEFLESGAITSLSKDKALVGWGEPQYRSAQEICGDKPAFYFSDFFQELSRPWIQYNKWTEISKKNLYNQLTSEKDLGACDWSIRQPQLFQTAFDQLWHMLQIEKLKKGVPYLFTSSTSSMTHKRLQSSLKAGLSSLENSAGYLYGHWHASQGVLGISPELLFSHCDAQPKKVQTMALAGTCRIDQTHDSMLKNEKERHEHQLVIEGICHSLRSLGNVKVDQIQLLELRKLMHLMTPIELELNQDFDFGEMVRALHPTPALGAFPKEEGKKWLLNFQKHTPRQFYGAPVGFQHGQKGISQCFVGIRNVQWDQSGMRIGAGCGVVKQSRFENEWQEIQLKIQAIRDQLRL